MARRWALALLALAAAARADGAMLSAGAPARTPDQRVILVWQEGHERLVLDAAYEAAGAEIAWIVPLPSPARVRPVAPAVFRTVEAITAPPIVATTPGWWKLGIYLFLLAIAISMLPARMSKLRIFVTAVGLGLPFAGLASQGLARDRPTIASVPMRPVPGTYDDLSLVEVAATDLPAWLATNGFEIPEAVRGRIDACAADGWSFTVARLGPPGEAGRHQPHPLCFEFEAEMPVVPLRLAAAQGGPLALELFVFADRQARCAPLDLFACYRIEPDEGRYVFREVGDTRDPSQPELAALVGPATMLTRLTGEIPPGSGDAQVSFGKYESRVPKLYSPAAVRDRAASVAVWLALLLAIPCYAVLARRHAKRVAGPRLRRARAPGLPRRQKLLAWGIAISAGAVAGAVIPLLFTSTPVREAVAVAPGPLLTYHQNAAAQIEGTHDLQAARGRAETIWRGRVNPYSALPMREEASPGNYGVAMREGAVRYLYYDARGSETWVRRR